MKVTESQSQKRDWNGPEQDYRAGILTLRQIGALHGVTHTAVRKRAKASGWNRDLTVRVRQRTEEKLALRAAVAPATGDWFPVPVSKESKARAEFAVECSSEIAARVRLKHRDRIAQAGALFDALLLKLEREIRPADGETSAPDLSVQINMFGQLTTCLTKIVAMERREFRLDETPLAEGHGRKSLPIRFIESRYEERDEESLSPLLTVPPQ